MISAHRLTLHTLASLTTSAAIFMLLPTDSHLPLILCNKTLAKLTSLSSLRLLGARKITPGFTLMYCRIRISKMLKCGSSWLAAYSRQHPFYWKDRHCLNESCKQLGKVRFRYRAIVFASSNQLQITQCLNFVVTRLCLILQSDR